MFPEERQRVILDRARGNGRVDVGTLAAEFAVTAETIRRDLSILERQGGVRRVHGGAIPVERQGFEASLASREAVMAGAKARIAAAALAELPESGLILLDAGTTTARLAEALPTDRDLTVVTPSVDVALILVRKPNVAVMLVGGRLRGRSLACVDAWALQSLRETFVEVAFLGADGVSAEHGLTTPDLREAEVKRAAVGCARRRVLLADHTKVGTAHFARFAELADVDLLITDAGIPAAAAAGISAAGPKVVTV